MPARPSELPSDDASSPRARVDDLEPLFHRHYGSLCEFVRQYVKSREVAEELVQDLFVRLWELQSGPAPQELAISYLYTAARNRAIGYLRRERTARRWVEQQLAESGPPAEEPPADALHYKELATAVARATAALPERCRLIFTMSRHQGLSYADIAQALDISVKTVETQMSRALKRLRVELAPFLGLVLTASLGRDLGRHLF